jgi:hypothetical protein
VPEIKFSVHDAGTPWTTIQSIFSFTSGAKPADAVMHLNFGNDSTGFAAETGPFITHVPDGGATVMLLGMAPRRNRYDAAISAKTKIRPFNGSTS